MGLISFAMVIRFFSDLCPSFPKEFWRAYLRSRPREFQHSAGTNSFSWANTRRCQGRGIGLVPPEGRDAVANQKNIPEAAFMLVPGHDPFGIPDLSDPTWALFH